GRQGVRRARQGRQGGHAAGKNLLFAALRHGDRQVRRGLDGHRSAEDVAVQEMSQAEHRYGWVVVAAGAFITCIAMGAAFSLPVFLAPITEATGWSRTGVSGAMTIVFLAMGLAGFASGALSDRFGARVVVLAGGVLLTLGLLLA